MKRRIITLVGVGVSALVLAELLAAQISSRTGIILPTGVGLIVFSGSCPSGTSEVSALNGKFLQGTVSANGDVGTTGGSATITPSGTVSQPTFTGSSGTTSAVSAGTPSGTVGSVAASASATIAVSTGSGNTIVTSAHTHPAPTFTGSALGTHTHTLTPAGTVSQPTFTGAAVDPRPQFVKVIFCSVN